MRRLFAIACTAVALLLLPATAAARTPFLTGIWGPIKFEPGEAGCTGPGRCPAFSVYQELGAEVFQFQIQWDQVAPKRPQDPDDPNDPAYHWSGDFQSAIDQAKAAGIRVMFLIKNSPRWANGGRARNWAPSPGAYAAFARAAALKFPDVRYWEIMGETNQARTFMPQGAKGARRYARIVDAAYRALKGVNRSNVVIGGMTLSGGPRRSVTPAPRWIKHLRLPNGKPPRMDWFGHNPYDRRYPRIKDRPIGGFRGLNDLDTYWPEVKRLYRTKHGRGRRWVFRKGRPTKLWLSEWSIQSDHASFAFGFSVSRAEQARWLRAGYALARRLPFVKGMSWYQVIDYPPAPNNPTWGLMTYDGERKPSFAAYRSLP
jgi:hypothetical protein